MTNAGVVEIRLFKIKS